MIRLFSALVAVVTLLALSGCRISDDPPPAPAPPTIVNVTPPASDGGLSVLLTISLIGAFVMLIVAALLFVLWLNERGRRRVSEDIVVELTGLPVTRTRVLMASGKLSDVRLGVRHQAIEREEHRALRP